MSFNYNSDRRTSFLHTANYNHTVAFRPINFLHSSHTILTKLWWHVLKAHDVLARFLENFIVKCLPTPPWFNVPEKRNT